MIKRRLRLFMINEGGESLRIKKGEVRCHYKKGPTLDTIKCWELKEIILYNTYNDPHISQSTISKPLDCLLDTYHGNQNKDLTFTVKITGIPLVATKGQ